MKSTLSLRCLLYSFILISSAFCLSFKDKICEIPRDSGPCKALFVKYAYDNETDACVPFNYGGCGGNDNRFSTQQECQNVCQPNNQSIKIDKPPVISCELKPETGPCFALFTRYYFNNETHKCEQFIYGGCAGNSNNFETTEECEQSCKHESELSDKYEEEDVCSLDADTGPCKASITRFYFNKSLAKCTPFNYGGCAGNANNFEAIEDCNHECDVNDMDSDKSTICEMKADSGPCEALIPRYHFNKTSGECEKFTYGGCQGNKNNFHTIDECTETCSSHEEYLEDNESCDLKPVVGNCRAALQRYYYDSDSKDCIQFIYGGCNGNDNNFETYELCQESCGK